MLQMFVLALSLYNTWNRGVFLLCKITNLLIYRIEDILEWKDICREIKNLAVTEIEKRYWEFLKEEPIGYNCNSLREYFINAFTFGDMIVKEERNIQKDICEIKKLFAKENSIKILMK